MDHTKSFSEVLELHSYKGIGQQIGYMLLYCHVLELHYPSLHHIHNTVELYLDVLRIVMEHRIL